MIFRIISIKVNGISLDALAVIHVLKVLNEQLIPYRHMGELGQVEIQKSTTIFLNTCVCYFYARDGDEFGLCSPMRFLRCDNAANTASGSSLSLKTSPKSLSSAIFSVTVSTIPASAPG